MHERELIERARSGDPAAERALYDAHVDRVYRLAYRLAGEDELAREVTQETFVRAFTQLGEFRGDAALSTWLHAIAVSLAFSAFRRIRRLRGREAPLEEARLVAIVPDPEPDLKAALGAAIDTLPEIYRIVFVMHDVEGYTHEEIGNALGIAAGSSKARLSRARARLREALAPFAEELTG